MSDVKQVICSQLIFFSIIVMYLILISVYIVFAEESSYPKPLLGQEPANVYRY
jgi:vacuolar-type H+-ATPase subunit I/STV1